VGFFWDCFSGQNVKGQANVSVNGENKCMHNKLFSLCNQTQILYSLGLIAQVHAWDCFSGQKVKGQAHVPLNFVIRF